MVTVKLYKCSSEPNRINKTLGDGVTVTGLLYGGANVLTPVIDLQGATLTGQNYAYIQDTGRYYFVTDIQVRDANITRLQLKTDVLFTYREQINNAVGTMTASENGDKFLNTRANIYNTVPKPTRYDFTGGDTFNSDGNIIMVALKGL